MWVLMENGGAIDNNTGEEIYMNLGGDGLVRVYRDQKVIAVHRTVRAAKFFIEDFVQQENNPEGD